MTPDLFEQLTLDDWLSDPLKAQETLEKSKARARGKEVPANTLAQYHSMLRSALTWMSQQEVPLSLETVSADDLDRYLKTKTTKRGGGKASSATLDRHLKRLQEVFSAFCSVGGRADNPADTLLGRVPFKAGLYSRDDPRVMNPEEWDAYIKWVRLQPVGEWFEVRDRALRIIFLATGITMMESRLICLKDVDLGKRTIAIHAHGKVPEHDALISDWAVPDIAAWIAERRKMLAKESAILFVGRTPGRASETADDEAMSESEIFEVISQPFMDSDADLRFGPQALRNSYIARQLHLKVDPAQLIPSLGLHTSFTLDQIRKQVEKTWGIAHL